MTSSVLMFSSNDSFKILLLIFSFTVPVFAFDVRNSHVVNVNSLVPSDVCTSSKDFGGLVSGETILKVVHRHGPCFPLEPLEKKLSPEQILSRDQARVDSIHRHVSDATDPSKISDPFSTSKIDVQSGHSFDSGNYVISIGIGTPVQNFHVVFDTGSDVTWIQCDPCAVFCYPQQDPRFKPSQSSTYSNISCTSSYCTDLSLHDCSGSTCVYGVVYGDKSQTTGFYAEDTLALTSNDIIPQFRFGCGEDNKGTLYGKIAGIFGLGRDKSSFISQTSDKYGSVFAYCLPVTSSSTGYLTFGSGSPMSNMKFTPLLLNQNSPTYYYLEMTGISVGGDQLSISPTVFKTAGTIIDSGTVITRLPPDAYSALRDAFKQKMTQYQSAQPVSLFDTCYDFTGVDNVTIPTVGIQFSGNVSLELKLNGILYGNSPSEVCLAFAGNESPTDLGIFGNVQQRGLNVLYDLPKQVVGFSPQDC